MAEIPTAEEARDWLRRHLASAPERDERWIRETFSIYRLSRREALAARSEDH